MAKLLINIDVDDLEKAIGFYTQAFALSVGRRFGPHAIELLGAEVPFYLLRKGADSAPFAGADASRRYQRHWTPVHFDFVVDDLDGAVARAVAAGALPEGPISQHEWGRMALMADPFGHGFCLLQLDGKGYDAMVTGWGA